MKPFEDPLKCIEALVESGCEVTLVARRQYSDPYSSRTEIRYDLTVFSPNEMFYIKTTNNWSISSAVEEFSSEASKNPERWPEIKDPSALRW